MTTTTNTLKSLWGFHPCTYAVYRKLKALHKWYWQTVYDFHRWHRWWRKREENRIGPEPAYCGAFVLDAVWYKPVRMGGEDGFKVYPKTVTDHGIVELYQAARRPQPEPVPPLDAETLKRIEQLYCSVAAYSAE